MEVRPQPSRMCQLFWCTLLQDSPLRFWCCTDVLIIYTVALECVYGTVIIPKIVYLFFWPSLGLLQHTAIDSPTIYQLSIVLESPLVLLQTEDGVPSSVNPVAFNPCWSLPIFSTFLVFVCSLRRHRTHHTALNDPINPAALQCTATHIAAMHLPRNVSFCWAPCRKFYIKASQPLVGASCLPACALLLVPFCSDVTSTVRLFLLKRLQVASRRECTRITLSSPPSPSPFFYLPFPSLLYLSRSSSCRM